MDKRGGIVSLIRKAQERFSVLNSMMWRAHSTRPDMEMVYRDLFVRDITKLELEDVYYPVSWGANHSLLYLITRCFLELPISNAIELGAGQTSILLSQLNDRLKKNANITTVENDARWADTIQAKVNHQINTVDLVTKVVKGHKISHYGGRYFDPSVLYDFVLIDGPPAYKKEAAFNRLGALELLERNLADNFVVIVDDTQRVGESALVNLIRRKLQESKRDLSEAAIMASRQQHIFVGGSFFTAAYF